jgi:hypothetical protein
MSSKVRKHIPERLADLLKASSDGLLELLSSGKAQKVSSGVATQTWTPTRTSLESIERAGLPEWPPFHIIPDSDSNSGPCGTHLTLPGMA